MDEREPICPKCHLAIKPDQGWLMREGKRYHRECAPPPNETEKGNVAEEGPMYI